ncbi:MAG: Rpp14/Pop5 family protein [Candidatus Anstonellaceae archaeon]
MIKTTLKEKKRYILYKIKTMQKTDIKREEVEKIIEEFFGVYGIVKNGIKIIYYDEDKKDLIIRCYRGKEKEICPFFSLISHCNGKQLKFELLFISGTIAAIKRKKGIKISKSAILNQ